MVVYINLCEFLSKSISIISIVIFLFGPGAFLGDTSFERFLKTLRRLACESCIQSSKSSWTGVRKVHPGHSQGQWVLVDILRSHKYNYIGSIRYGMGFLYIIKTFFKSFWRTCIFFLLNHFVRKNHSDSNVMFQNKDDWVMIQCWGWGLERDVWRLEGLESYEARE